MVIDGRDHNHDFERETNFPVEHKDHGKYFWLRCKRCKIRVRELVGSDFYDVPKKYDRKTVKECVGAPTKYPKKVQIVDIESLYQWGFELDKVYTTLTKSEYERKYYDDSVICLAQIKRVEGDIEFERVRVLPHEFIACEESTKETENKD